MTKSGGKNNRYESSTTNWRDTIDVWVRDPNIRRHALIALAMVLGATVMTLGFASGVLADIMKILLPTLLARTLAGGTLGVGGTVWWLHRRRQHRELANSPDENRDRFQLALNDTCRRDPEDWKH